MDFLQAEERDGVRFSWNYWPATKNEAQKAVLPLGCLYTPFKKSSFPNVVQYEPIVCACHTVLNPFCYVDFQTKTWSCPFCYQKNAFPAHYQGISESNLPAELIPSFSTIEYLLPRTPGRAPAFLFVVDTVMLDVDIGPLREALLTALGLIPDNSFVGLITFGSNVQVYDLSHDVCPKSFVFNGSGNKLTPKRIQQLLGLSLNIPGQNRAAGGAAPQAHPAQKFLVELSECQATLASIFEELTPDPTPVKPGERGLRATGLALQIAVTLMETVNPHSPGRIMSFVTGPCTHGPGQIAGTSLKEILRAHRNISEGGAKYLAKAIKYYDELAERAGKSGQAVDIFTCSLDQTGLYEMASLVRRTGGVMVSADLTDSPIFSESLRILLEREEEENNTNLKMAFNASIEVHASREIKINGAIGHCLSLDKKSPIVSETEVGVGGTSAWRCCSLDPNSALAIIFEVTSTNPPPGIAQGARGYLQFQTAYVNSQGRQVLRITTVSNFYVDPNAGPAALAAGFDQEAAAVLVTKIAAHKANSQDPQDIMRWIDRSLVRLANRFGQFIKDDPSTFQLASNFSLYPQFMFHLRRGNILQHFGYSPDETCYTQSIVIRQTTADVLLMIQPYMEAYVMGQEPVPVLLSATSMLPDRVLLLDTFLSVVVWYGSNIVDWRKQGYQNDPAYAHLRDVLEKPKLYIEGVKKGRFPYPNVLDADQGTGAARSVTSVVDPAVTHSSRYGAVGGEAIMTDDVNLEVFMEHLKKLAVQSQ
eukprot:TRINITY_DN714_c1_g1_i1.p1 TRINITY_DN714_c1_g1~~TRINITY_DN714_c1_g1_i1.p1  ORF type:complete len:761 (-),score=311.13 TRINITY_DN714_c1_g1_i1:105-2387(-)